MQEWDGERVLYAWPDDLTLRRRRHHRFRLGRQFLYLMTHDALLRLEHRPRWGLFVHSVRDRHDRRRVLLLVPFQDGREMLKRRQVAAGEGVALPPLADTSVYLPKNPVLRKWCSATSYDDGSPRVPGGWRIENMRNVYRLTVTDPDSAARLSICAATLDECFKLIETYLTAEDAPWEHDNYLAGLLAKRPKNKKRAS